MKILAFHGSPRSAGNTSHLVRELLRGANEVGADLQEITASQLNLKFCRGCMRCNLIGYCSVRNDEWPSLSKKILDADALVIASPVYMHYMTASMKKIMERFRSFMHIQASEKELVYKPWHEWKKHFILILSMASSSPADATPIVDFFKFIIEILGPGNELITVIGNRLLMVNQVVMNVDELKQTYSKISLPEHLAEPDYLRNQELLSTCYELGKKLASAKTQQDRG